LNIPAVLEAAVLTAPLRPTMAALAVMMVKMALRHTPVGEQAQSRYVLVGFQPDGEPLIDLRALS